MGLYAGLHSDEPGYFEKSLFSYASAASSIKLS